MVLLLLAVAVAAQSPRPRPMGYEFSIGLPDTGRIIHGRAAIHYRRGRPSDDTLRLDLVGMTVDSVQEAWFAYDRRVLRVVPNHWFVGDNTLVIYYHGAPEDGLLIGQDPRGRRVVFADNWPERARYWLPVVDAPSEKAWVRFTIVAPPSWKYVANGMPVYGVDGGGERLIGWDEAHPIPTYTMVLAAGDFAVSVHRSVPDGKRLIPIQVWTYAEDSAYADSVPFRRATDIVEAMQRLVGSFPYEKLTHVESSTKFGGMENASAIFYADRPYVERRMGEGVVRHETAHQWFGDAVTERDWHHLWLSEGFASYFDWVIGAALDGDSVLDRGMRANADSYFRSRVVDRPIIDTAEHDLLKLLNANNYQKGSWVLHMLRGQIGDSAFWRGIREYYRRYRDSTALSGDFERVMEESSGQTLDWFFRQWLYQPGYPQLDCRWVYDGASHRVALTVSQTQPAAWGVFRLPQVAVEMRGEGGAVVRRGMALAGRETRVTFGVSLAPTDLRIDPDGRLLAQALVRR
jgi:aminopeptidase N